MIERKDEFIALMKEKLQERRFLHSLNVADAAVKLAEKYGEDTERAYICGLLHDIEKNSPDEEQKEYMLRFPDIPEVVIKTPKLWHAPAGAAFVRDELGIDDEEMVSAIRYHTTAKANMTMLEKIIYIADFISDERDYPGVDEVREAAFSDIDEAVLIGTRFTLEDLLRQDRVINQDTIDAYNEVCKKREEQK